VKPTIPSRYRQLRASAPFDSVSFGYHAIRLAAAAELEQAQEGYGLVSDEASAWDADWVVIGHDEMCGDPVFIDTADDDFPVYTAEHGAGEWRPQLIAFSFQHLIDILGQFRRFRGGRTSPVELERQPITPEEKTALLAFIQDRNPDVNSSIWEDWLGYED
jgi:hypothetical protein